MNILLNITQCCICDGFKSVNEKSYNITSTSQTITLNNGYTLSIISYSANSVHIILQNNNNIFIRVLHTSFPFEMCFNASNNCCFFLTISLSSVN